MKNIVTISLPSIVFVCMILFACNTVNKKKNEQTLQDFKEMTLELKDSLGTITMYIPNRYDTFAQWTHKTDCVPCGKEKYRYQPKFLKLYLENGFIDTNEPKDSIENLTIVHSVSINKSKLLEKDLIYKMHKSEKEQYLNGMYRANMVKEDTVLKINDRYFSLFVFEHFDSTRMLYNKKVSAETLINNNSVKFINELVTRNNNSINNYFIKNSKLMFNSIKISNK